MNDAIRDVHAMTARDSLAIFASPLFGLDAKKDADLDFFINGRGYEAGSPLAGAVKNALKAALAFDAEPPSADPLKAEFDRQTVIANAFISARPSR